MTVTQSTAPSARTVRIVHAALLAGVVLFALVAHFVLRPTMAQSGQLRSGMSGVLLGLSIVACGFALLLLRAMPRRSANESTEEFWRTAAPRALQMWAPLEGASLLAVYVYAHTGTTAAIAIVVLAVLLFLLLNPSYLEGQR